MRPSRLAVLLLVVALAPACAARLAYRQGSSAAQKGQWDLAVARFTRALEKDPDNIGYKIALENARIQASRQHYAAARKHVAADELDKAKDELTIATNYDPSNKAASDDLALVTEKIHEREAEKKRLSEFDQMRSRAEARVPVPVLAPRSQVPIYLNFPEQSLKKVFEALSKLSGVNILFEEGFRDKRVTVRLQGVTFQHAIDQITLVNRLFYKVLDPNTLLIIPESPTKRRAYDEQLVRTFYLSNADVTETATMLKALLGIQKVFPNATLGAVTVMGTPDQLAAAARVIRNNDKSRGEVMAEVQILEVNRNKMKDWGIDLANYQVSTTFSPTGAQGEVSDTGFTSVRAHLLSSLNLSDFVVNVPATLFARFLQTDSTVKILANPRLRAAEGKQTTLEIGTEVPVPVTTFTATQAGTSTFAPATSFQYRNVGVTLDLKPTITAEGDITLEMKAEFSLLGDDRNVGTGQNPIVVPTFLSRKVSGTLRLKDGETSLIGGLLQGRETTTLRGALGLENVPILNKLFNSTNKKNEDTEILISITPHLVRAPRVTEKDLTALDVGTQEAMRVAGARPLFGAEGPPAGPEAATPATAPSPAPAPPEPSPAPEPTPTPSPEPAESPAPAPSPPPAPKGVLFSPRDLPLAVGETGQLSVVVMSAEDLVGVEASLSYDPAALEVVEVTPGSLLTLDGSMVAAQRNLESGRVQVSFRRPSETAGSGAVVTLKLKPLRPGSTLVMIDSLDVTTTTGSQAAALPAPATVEATAGGTP